MFTNIFWSSWEVREPKYIISITVHLFVLQVTFFNFLHILFYLLLDACAFISPLIYILKLPIPLRFLQLASISKKVLKSSFGNEFKVLSVDS